NTNYYGTADPNEVGLVGQNNDNYFRTNGQLKELWIYRDGMWHLEVGDLTGEQIRAEVEQAQQDIAEAKIKAEQDTEKALEDAKKYADEEVARIDLEITTNVNKAISTAEEAKQD